MPSAFFLAQTAAEIHRIPPYDARRAWMACHFSPYGTGLSNLPEGLPPGSMVILNDRTPVAGHDPGLIAAQLAQLAEEEKVSHILLDFQRTGEARTAAIARAVAEVLPCPVGVAAGYAKELDCAVFLPPLPLHTAPEDYIAPWQGRPVWLELAPACGAYTVTQQGCTQSPWASEGEFPHLEETVCCRYRTEVETDAIRFILKRGPQELKLLRNAPGIDCFVGLYQEFAQPEAQATALAQ